MVRRPMFRADRYLKGLRPVKQVARQHRRAYRALIKRAALAARDCGEVWTVRSSYRTYTEQLALYNAYKAGKGNLAAAPGSSMHEHGRALDLGGPDNSDLGKSTKRRRAAEKHGLMFPLVSEPWHVEYRG